MTCRFWHRFLLASAMALVFRGVSPAAVILSLDDRGVDLNNLAVGQTVTLDLVLSGLGPAEELGYLAGTIGFSPNFLGTAMNVIAGPIVPDPPVFVGSGSPGVADGYYDFLFSSGSLSLNSNGVFFSFDVTTQNPGSGTFDLTFLDAQDLNFNPAMISAGAPLTYAINGNTAVPEPSSLIIFLTGASFLLALQRRNQTITRVSV